MIDFAHHQTTQALWECLAVTFESSSDPYLLYDLEEKAGQITQGEQDLETYWRHLHGTWIDVDRCQHQPVDCCDKGIGQFRRYIGTRRLFKFLTGLHPRYDPVKLDIPKETPWPSAEVAYGTIKREAARLKLMPATNTDPTGATNDSTSSSGGIGLGFAARNQQRMITPPQRPGPPSATHRRPFKQDKSKLWCSHCGKQKHTKDSCFILVGFPEWWDENQKAKARLAIGVNNGRGVYFQQPERANRRSPTLVDGKGQRSEKRHSPIFREEAVGVLVAAGVMEVKD